VTIRFEGTERAERDHHRVTIMTWNGNANLSGGGIVDGAGSRVAIGPSEVVQNVPFTIRVMADGKYVKVYMNSTRVANVPNADLGRANRIVVEFDASQEQPAFFRNIRVAAGGRKLYDAIAAEGRVATQGIYFDTGSDRLRPESSPTLKEIAAMLKEHADLRLAIEGHTDNVGQAAANQTLSEARAAAVRKTLVDTYGIDASRLESKGLGATKPVGANDTPEGRQSNRRVELVKL
jgi:outer membrane protein OmpA-like peptidoglycan-associated protein